MKLNRIEIRINDFEKHCIDVLKDTYKINPSQFIRIAFQEKLKRDIPKLREKHKKSECPF